MGKSNRREVAKRLAQEIAVTTDPETLIRLSSQLAKVMPKRRRWRKPAEKPKKNAPLPDGNQVFDRVVERVEAKCRTLGKSDETRKVVTTEVLKTLSPEEREALEALNTVKVV